MCLPWHTQKWGTAAMAYAKGLQPPDHTVCEPLMSLNPLFWQSTSLTCVLMIKNASMHKTLQLIKLQLKATLKQAGGASMPAAAPRARSAAWRCTCAAGSPCGRRRLRTACPTAAPAPEHQPSASAAHSWLCMKRHTRQFLRHYLMSSLPTYLHSTSTATIMELGARQPHEHTEGGKAGKSSPDTR